MTDVFEGEVTQKFVFSVSLLNGYIIIRNIVLGSIIRCMRRLEELLRQMVQAAKNIGNTELENRFASSIKLLKRDIVFAASLYL